MFFEWGQVISKFEVSDKRMRILVGALPRNLSGISVHLNNRMATGLSEIYSYSDSQ